MQESTSFWTDIKDLEEQLSKSPDSLCFARLSEVYLKVGLIDDALHVARLGVMKHPRYLSGQRAFSYACHAKGLDAETLIALNVVTEALPEDVPSQKLLGRLLTKSGKLTAARHAFVTALEFAPDDVECRIELESLERSAATTGYDFESDISDEEDDEVIIENLEVVEESEYLQEKQPESKFQATKVTSGSDVPAASSYDPLSTSTLAELYVKQGFIHKAIEIYSKIMAENPEDISVAERVAVLKAMEAILPESDSDTDNGSEEEVENEPVSNISVEAFFQDTGAIESPESAVITGLGGRQSFVGDSDSINEPSVLPSQGVSARMLSTFEGWLGNIGRIKSCR